MNFCPDCESYLTTKIIPHDNPNRILNLECNNCGYKNNEVTFGGKINDYATRINLKVIKMDDFKRDCVKSEHCSLRIPELDFEVPSSKKGSVNTIEGFIVNAIEDLESD